ncbi:hypothetical protein [Dysgonomonas termitidis]|uniref:Lipoprotein n=1 Tax=Dysgonomonas termitidis TaxID=1516126 RepID=A0ABV9L3A0_9BACT
MKKLLFIFIIVSIFSCSQKNEYEKLIREYAQTNKQGVFTDCQFESIEIKELPPITVSDSINFLKNTFEDDNKAYIKRQETLLKMSLEYMEIEKKARFKSQVIIDGFMNTIDQLNNSIDSVKQLNFKSRYDGLNVDKVLLQPVECRYSYVFPAGNPRQERTDIFYFLPDLSKITGQKQIRK